LFWPESNIDRAAMRLDDLINDVKPKSQPLAASGGTQSAPERIRTSDLGDPRESSRYSRRNKVTEVIRRSIEPAPARRFCESPMFQRIADQVRCNLRKYARHPQQPVKLPRIVRFRSGAQAPRLDAHERTRSSRRGASRLGSRLTMMPPRQRRAPRARSSMSSIMRAHSFAARDDAVRRLPVHADHRRRRLQNFARKPVSHSKGLRQIMRKQRTEHLVQAQRLRCDRAAPEQAAVFGGTAEKIPPPCSGEYGASIGL